MKNLFIRNTAKLGLSGFVEQLQDHVNRNGSGGLVQKEIGQSLISLESAEGIALERLTSSVTSLKATLETISESASFKGGNAEAGVLAGMMSSSVIEFVKRTPQALQSTPSHQFVPATGGVPRLKAALEAYDEKENRNAAVYSVAYNMQAARQDEFGEALFPTVVVTPDQVGFTMSINLIRVMNDVRRGTNGALANFEFKNIVHAVRDPSILGDESTNIVPIVRTGSESNFVDNGLVAPHQATVGGEVVETAPLLFGKKFDLIGLSQTDALLATGMMDPTDSIDTAITLDAVYLKAVGSNNATEVVKFTTKRLPLATFVANPQDNYRSMVLNFHTDALTVDAATKQVDGSNPVLLADVVSGNWVVKLSVNVSGSVNLQTGETTLMTGGVSVVSVTGTDGEVLPPTASSVSAIAALFNGATLIGYDLGARRTNMNRRQRGQLLDLTTFNQTYAIPLLSPITVPRPLGTGDGTDASDLAALITATRIRTSNAAVDALLEAAATLKEFVTGRETIGDTVEVMGVARFLVNPVFESLAFDAAQVTQSLSSHQRAADIQAALVSAIRDIAYRMYRDSGYKAAADALKGGQSEAPTVIIATDPVLSRYLTVTGDLRTLGNDFKVKIVSTLNVRMTGKIMVTFGDFDSGAEGAPNPLHFGNMGWKPEMTLVLPLHRNGANSKELTVQPSYLHVVNLPVLAEITVTGISDLVVEKVPYQVHTN